MQSPVLISHNLTLWSEEAVIRYLKPRVCQNEANALRLPLKEGGGRGLR